MSVPRKASAEIRLLILDAIKDTHRRFLDPNTPSRRFLDHWDITEEGFFSRLADDLADYEIFLKPKDKPTDLQRYQSRLIYEAEPPDYPTKASLPELRWPCTQAIPSNSFPKQKQQKQNHEIESQHQTGAHSVLRV
jgi:hypothetical protein